MRDLTSEILELIRRTSSSLPKDVDAIYDKNTGNNLGGDDFPYIHFEEVDADQPLVIELMLKGGGCENVGAQHSLPDNKLGAGRDLGGVRKMVVQGEEVEYD